MPHLFKPETNDIREGNDKWAYMMTMRWLRSCTRGESCYVELTSSALVRLRFEEVIGHVGLEVVVMGKEVNEEWMEWMSSLLLTADGFY